MRKPSNGLPNLVQFGIRIEDHIVTKCKELADSENAQMVQPVPIEKRVHASTIGRRVLQAWYNSVLSGKVLDSSDVQGELSKKTTENEILSRKVEELTAQLKKEKDRTEGLSSLEELNDRLRQTNKTLSEKLVIYEQMSQTQSTNPSYQMVAKNTELKTIISELCARIADSGGYFPNTALSNLKNSAINILAKLANL